MAGLDPLETFAALFRAIIDERDVEAFMRLWVDEPDATLWGSDLAECDVGLDRIRVHGELIADSPRALRFAFDERRVREAGDVAWINASGTLTTDGEVAPYRVTAVLVRRGGEWLWHTFSGSIPDA